MLHQHVFVNLTFIATPPLCHHHRAGHHSSLPSTMRRPGAGHQTPHTPPWGTMEQGTTPPIPPPWGTMQTPHQDPSGCWEVPGKLKWKGTTMTLHIKIFCEILKDPWTFSKQKAQGKPSLSPLWGNVLTTSCFGQGSSWRSLTHASPTLQPLALSPVTPDMD